MGYSGLPIIERPPSNGTSKQVRWTLSPGSTTSQHYPVLQLKLRFEVPEKQELLAVDVH